MTKETLIESGDKIAEIIIATRTEDRGLLFLEVERRLKEKTQFCTAMYFKGIAEDYGYPTEGK